MYQGKEVIVKLSEEATEIYNELNQIVEEEKLKGIDSSFHQTLLRSIQRVRDLLKQNPFAGEQVRKKQIPQKYISRYDVDNLWRIDLANENFAKIEKPYLRLKYFSIAKIIYYYC